MRPTLWLTLLAPCFVAFGCSAQNEDASPRPPEKVRVTVEKPGREVIPLTEKPGTNKAPERQPLDRRVGQEVPPFEKQVTNKAPASNSAAISLTAEGFGATDELARKDALRVASDRVADYLREKYKEATYKPSTDFLQQLKVLPSSDDIEVTSGTVPNMPEMKTATIQARVTDESVKKMREQARQERTTERQHWMGLGLAGIVALLLVGSGYLRLEEATKGYYTGLLRLSALGLLGLVGGAIWYLY